MQHAGPSLAARGHRTPSWAKQVVRFGVWTLASSKTAAKNAACSPQAPRTSWEMHAFWPSLVVVPQSVVSITCLEAPSAAMPAPAPVLPTKVAMAPTPVVVKAWQQVLLARGLLDPHRGGRQHGGATLLRHLLLMHNIKLLEDIRGQRL